SQLENNYIPQLCGRFSGNTTVVFYLTDMKKTVSTKSGLYIRICEESVAEIRKIYPVSAVGLIL
ncbi:MAG: hypothetical protein K2H26_03035, partial [Ruminococcus sp.]|nr:hypothetical protein [Ruminococcus sp.]